MSNIERLGKTIVRIPAKQLLRENKKDPQPMTASPD
jgi:hypothetical protein